MHRNTRTYSILPKIPNFKSSPHKEFRKYFSRALMYMKHFPKKHRVRRRAFKK